MSHALEPRPRRVRPRPVRRVQTARPGLAKRLVSAGAVLAVLGLVAGFALAPPPQPSAAVTTDAKVQRTQGLLVAADVPGVQLARDGLSVTPGVQTLAAGRTNHDWARLVLIYGEWPMTQDNVDVILRWMRQENGPPDWWNRNNPLNNGHGSGGGSGLGSYPDLVVAAEMAAENLIIQGSYDEIVASLDAGAPAEKTAQAIWASPWASSHYGYGTHWSTTPVPVVVAPESAW